MFFQIATDKQHPEAIKILQITDSHLLEDPTKHFAGVSPLSSLKAVLSKIQQEQDMSTIDIVLSTGDIAQEPSEKTYTQYLDTVAQLHKPHYWLRGNHDESDTFPKPDPKDAPVVLTLGQWCIILLNSQSDQCIYGEISQVHLTQLTQIIEKHSEHHVLIALHHHNFLVNSAWLDQHCLKNSTDFLACIASFKQVKAVISGHVHQAFEYQYQGISFLSTPSTFIQFKPNSEQFSLDQLGPAYRILNLYADGQFDTQVYYLPEVIGEIDNSITEY